jgi:hypothetical protein
MTSGYYKSFKPARILIFGMGDLGVRIARIIVENEYSSVCLLAGQSGAAEQWAQLLYLSTGRDVRSARVDGQDIEALQRLFTVFEPDVIVQCATLLSPFELKKVGTPAAMAILKGGFALQTAAQLPIIRTVMQARKAVGLRCPVINCSYPDVTNPMLALEGLAPSSGIGNVAIMALRFQRLIPDSLGTELRVVGHHSQLGSSLAGEPAASPARVPLVFLGDRRLEEKELLIKPGLLAGTTLNHLAAVTIEPILKGFLDRDTVTETHAPGVLGLQGGPPVSFMSGEVSLCLPRGLSFDQASEFNRISAAGDGVKGIGKDGTLFFTDEAEEAVAPWCPELAEPLKLIEIDKRLEILRTMQNLVR